jgi:hypothetical protein
MEREFSSNSSIRADPSLPGASRAEQGFGQTDEGGKRLQRPKQQRIPNDPERTLPRKPRWRCAPIPQIVERGELSDGTSSHFAENVFDTEKFAQRPRLKRTATRGVRRFGIGYF